MTNKIKKIIACLITFSSIYAQDYTPKNEGVKQNFKNKIAITNATIYITSSEKIEQATLLIQDDIIEAVGQNITIPNGTAIINAQNKIIYPAFIDLFSEFGIQKPQKKNSNLPSPQYNSERSGYYWNDHIRSDFNAFENIFYDEKSAKEFKENGFSTVITHFNDGIIAGTGVLWNLNDKASNNQRILNQKISQHLSFNRSSLSNQSYPSSLMGSMALLRQFYHDANWYAAGNNKSKDLSIESYLQNKNSLQIFNANDKLNILRADKIADEFGLNYIIKTNGFEYEYCNEIKNTKATLIVPLKFPEPYDVSNPYLSKYVTLTEMKQWNQAPFNLKILNEQQIPFCITSSDLKNPKDFLPNLRKTIELGFPKQKALYALTEFPAFILKNNKIGNLKPGSLANFIIASGDIFENSKNTIQETWVQGTRTIFENINTLSINGKYKVNFNNQDLDLIIEGSSDKPEFKLIQNNKEINIKTNYNFPWLELTFKLDKNEYYRISGFYENNQFKGKAILENGTEINWKAIKENTNNKTDIKKEETSNIKPNYIPITFPNTAFGFEKLPQQETYTIKNTTVWTGEKEGILKNTDVILENGKISKIGQNLTPKGIVIDGTEKHLTAGIIDEHSHIAISNGVNESGQNSSAEVTIEDVINPDDINIYRNLAGGVTSAQLLHGSSNPIGGRSAFIKLKWGYKAHELQVKDAPKYIKFALGENVKQSNSSDRLRFPQSRMGVEQVFEDYFTQAIHYKKQWDDFKSNKTKIKPRYDLELETINEILDKKRFITCHSYVQSEINMLMKVAKKYNIKIQTFTHILEGYKLADKMKEHGVGGSTFADWWAYKYEVMDAIPHNAAIMKNEGVTVSINSDDAEMSRRLNQEAAKTVKYGNVSEEEAWNFVTLNPAKLLQMDHRIGSIKIGKDADVVLWNENPLSIYAKAEKTFVEGILFYDINKQEEIINAIAKQRNTLINLMLEEKNKGVKTQEPKMKPANHYHCDTQGDKCRIVHGKYNQ